MPIAWDNEAVGTSRTTLQDYSPPLGYTVLKAAEQTWADNPITRVYQWGQSALANDGAKLDANQIDDLVKGAGVQGVNLEPGKYTQDAASIIVERQRQRQIAQNIDERTDYGWGTPVRALTRAAVMLADPLNMAAMFVPGLGEEWAASRIAAGAGRFSTRMMQGATQGAAGMGALEAINLPAARALQDDYHATDSLINVLTGAVLGGVLHGVGGAFLDSPKTTELRGEKVPGIRYRPPDVEAAPLETNIAAANTAISQVLQDQPVEVNHLYTDIPKVSSIPDEQVTWDTISPNQSVTLYRGESAQNDRGGQWWTTNPDRAATYGTVQSVTLPSEVVGNNAVRGHLGADEFLFPTEGKRPLDLVGKESLPISASIDELRARITANRERNILDGDGLPPRSEPKVASAEASANPELTARLQDIQARAATADQELKAAVQSLQDQGYTARTPELKAADTGIAKAEAEAQAYKRIIDCQRLA